MIKLITASSTFAALVTDAMMMKVLTAMSFRMFCSCRFVPFTASFILARKNSAPSFSILPLGMMSISTVKISNSSRGDSEDRRMFHRKRVRTKARRVILALQYETDVTRNPKQLACFILIMSIVSGGSKGGAGDARPPGVQILSFSCSFWEILAKSYVGPPPRGVGALLGEILDPPLIGIIVQKLKVEETRPLFFIVLDLLWKYVFNSRYFLYL